MLILAAVVGLAPLYGPRPCLGHGLGCNGISGTAIGGLDNRFVAAEPGGVASGCPLCASSGEPIPADDFDDREDDERSGCECRGDRQVRVTVSVPTFSSIAPMTVVAELPAVSTPSRPLDVDTPPPNTRAISV